MARTYGVSPGWVSKLVARYRAEGDAAFEPRSRRPKTSPRALDPSVVARIVALRRQLTDVGADAGPDTIQWHLEHFHRVSVSTTSISRYLSAAGLVTPQPHKRPRSSYIRFEADQPNECWQSDFTHYRLVESDGSPGRDTEILTWLDDHSRFALVVTRSRPGHRSDRPGPLPRSRCNPRDSCLHADRQWHGLHHSTGRGQGRTQRLRVRTPPSRRPPEELPAEPPDHLREGRTVPADDEEVAPGPTSPADHPSTSSRTSSTSSSTSTTTTGPTGRSSTDRHQERPIWPVRRRSRAIGDSTPRPGPHRRGRHHRLGDTACPRTPSPHRDGTNPRRNPRCPSRLRPACPGRPCLHRRAPPGTDH